MKRDIAKARERHKGEVYKKSIHKIAQRYHRSNYRHIKKSPRHRAKLRAHKEV